MNTLSRYTALIISLLVIIALCYFFSNIVGYVVIAWILSMIGQPLMVFFQTKIRIGKWSPGPNLAAAMILISYLIIITLLVSLFVPLFIKQANNLAEANYENIATALDEPIQHMNAWLAEYGLTEPGTVDTEEQLKKSFKLEEWFNPGFIGDIFSYALAAAGNLIIGMFSVIFITFFFLKEQGLFTNAVAVLVPSKYERQVRNAIESISRLLTRYFGGILLQMSIITIFVTIGLTLLGVKNALLIAFFAALINVIPYIGPIIGAAFGMFVTVSSNLDLNFYTEMFPLIIKVIVVFGLMQTLDNFVLQPFIFSNSVLAHPLEIFIVILMGAKLGGVTGMILAIPSYTVLRVIARAFLSEFRIVQKITGSMRDI
ncbi:MAG: AI-2E family transporter [Saprospiraceae bacterium]|nr:AI-2E family transporter [Saprospiraceae bacterium]